MKKLFSHTAVKAAFFILLYLIGLCVGILIVGVYPIYAHQREGNIKHSYTIGEEYLQGKTDELEHMRNAYRHIILLDSTKKCAVLETFDRDHSEEEFIDFLSPWTDRVFEGKESFAITTSRFSPAPMHFWMVSGVPILENDSVSGAVFMIENIQNLQEASLGFIIYFTVFYWFCVYMYVITARNRRRLENVRQEYIANIAHALKTPNSSIKVMTEALCDDMITDEDMKKVYYGRILKEVNSQNRMVGEILELSRLQTLQGSPAKKAVTTSELFDEVTEKYAMLCDCTDVSLHVSESISALPVMHTNADSIHQILELILDNAIKFVPVGGNVWIDSAADKRKVTVSIRDDGPGISEKDLPHIFERFYRCKRDDGGINGSGLGLAIVNELCHALKEKVWAESKLGNGTTIKFTISRK